MNREIAQIKRITGSPFFARGIRFGLWKVVAAAAVSCLLCSAALLAADDDHPFLPGPIRVVSTVPANGDGNPYGVAFVPPNFPAGGAINPGDVLVSNFNNAPTMTGGNLQGTGTTIVDVPPNAPLLLYFQSSTPTGLTTALNVLQRGFVLVGNFPSADGLCADAGTGSIIVLDKNGNVVSTYTDSSVQGPWDSALFDQGGKAKYFVANALTGGDYCRILEADAGGIDIQFVAHNLSG